LTSFNWLVARFTHRDAPVFVQLGTTNNARRDSLLACDA
jgi:hypothetical protein